MNMPWNIITPIMAACSLGLTLTGCVSTQTDVAEHAAHNRMGSHGMAVIGSTNLLLHHMPLYRPPHDRQILTPATFADEKSKIAFDKWRQSYIGLVSIVPENFDLDRLDPGAINAISSFTADIYEGHFERGGQVKFESVRFKLGRPVFHRPVTENAASSLFYTYLRHGNEAYLVRDIGPRPGTDEILTLGVDANLTSGERVRFLSNMSDNGGLKVVKDDQSILDIAIRKTVYLETSDFQSQP